ncbi:MAG: methyltransferase [Thiohalophilus sp.]
MAMLQQHRFKVWVFNRLMALANKLAVLPGKLTPPPFRLIQIGSAFWQSRALYVAASLGLADELGESTRSSAELADSLSLDEDHLYRLMRMLASIGIFTEHPGRRFSNSNLSDCLRSDHPKSVRAMIMLHNSPTMSLPWYESLEPAIRTGETPFVLSHGADLFTYMDDHPELDQAFSRAMDTVENLIGSGYLFDFDWSRFDRLIDVGGSQGSKSLAILKQQPRLKALVFDRPKVIAGAKEYWRQQGEIAVLERMEFEGGDMLEVIPRANSNSDIYLFAAIFHGMDDEQACKVLQNLREAMGETGASAVIADNVAAECGIDQTIAGFDMQMLVNTRGRERTESEWHSLLGQVSFAIDEIVDVSNVAKFIVIRIK